MTADTKLAMQYASAIRRKVISPACLALSSAIACFVWLANPGAILGVLDFWYRGLFVFATMVAFLAWSYWGVADILWRAYYRGWPLLPLHTLFYAPLGLAVALILACFDPNGFSPVIALRFFSVIFALIGISAALGFALNHSFAPAGARLDVTAHQFLWFRKDGCPLITQLETGKQGVIKRLSAANQYITVHTTAGDSLLRMTLKEAEAQIDTGHGMRVHRSHWVAFTHMRHLTYDKGNPRLLCADGTIVPVSRSRLDAVRGHIGPGAVAR